MKVGCSFKGVLKGLQHIMLKTAERCREAGAESEQHRIGAIPACYLLIRRGTWIMILQVQVTTSRNSS